MNRPRSQSCRNIQIALFVWAFLPLALGACGFLVLLFLGCDDEALPFAACFRFGADLSVFAAIVQVLPSLCSFTIPTGAIGVTILSLMYYDQPDGTPLGGELRE